MKFSKIIVSIILLVSVSSFTLNNSDDKKWQEANIYVKGVCDMCETRIEKAALIKGVKIAEWDKHKQNLFVVYRPDKVSIKDIEKVVSEAGHDTKNFKAPDEVYNSLPKCCKYRSELKVH